MKTLSGNLIYSEGKGNITGNNITITPEETMVI
jgi:hypothetical protein